jgi:hypothetical protein
MAMDTEVTLQERTSHRIIIASWDAWTPSMRESQ